MIGKKGKHVVSVAPEGIERRLGSPKQFSGTGASGPSIRGPPGIDRRLRYSDLVDRHIVNNRVTLQNWINKQGFPPGQLTGPNSRTWGENEIQIWLDSRPIAPKPTPNAKRRRKAQAEQRIAE